MKNLNPKTNVKELATPLRERALKRDLRFILRVTFSTGRLVGVASLGLFCLLCFLDLTLLAIDRSYSKREQYGIRNPQEVTKGNR